MKRREPIDLINCSELLEDARWNAFFADKAFQQKINNGHQFFCPNIDSLEIQGQSEFD